MIVDRCKPTNDDHRDTVRIVLGVDEAERICRQIERSVQAAAHMPELCAMIDAIKRATGRGCLSVSHVFHMAWTACAGEPGYDKNAWKELAGDIEIHEMTPEQIRRKESALFDVGRLLRAQGGNPAKIEEAFLNAVARAQMAPSDEDARTELKRLARVLGRPGGAT